jgi:hypothetical protein
MIRPATSPARLAVKRSRSAIHPILNSPSRARRIPERHQPRRGAGGSRSRAKGSGSLSRRRPRRESVRSRHARSAGRDGPPHAPVRPRPRSLAHLPEPDRRVPKPPLVYERGERICRAFAGGQAADASAHFLNQPESTSPRLSSGVAVDEPDASGRPTWG